MNKRKFPFLNGEYYHVYNRGVDKRDIFSDKSDVFRFVESVIEFNTKNNIQSLQSLRRNFKSSIPTSVGLEGLQSKQNKKEKEPIVSIFAYCLNPNHFHFFLRQDFDDGVSKFMQKLQSGYTGYFNIKNKRSGALFQGKFKAQIVQNEAYFMRTFGYVNKNYLVHEIPENKKSLILSSDYEYNNQKFKVIQKENAQEIIEKFGSIKAVEKLSIDVIDEARRLRGKEELENDFL